LLPNPAWRETEAKNPSKQRENKQKYNQCDLPGGNEAGKDSVRVRCLKRNRRRKGEVTQRLSFLVDMLITNIPSGTGSAEFLSWIDFFPPCLDAFVLSFSVQF